MTNSHFRRPCDTHCNDNDSLYEYAPISTSNNNRNVIYDDYENDADAPMNYQAKKSEELLYDVPNPNAPPVNASQSLGEQLYNHV